MALGHDQPEAVFTSWNQTWLSPAMSHWSVERELSSIACPVLAVQGLDDEFGTLEQIRGVARRVPTTRLSELMNCGHEPHLDQPEAVLVAARKFVELYGTKTSTTTATSA
jgi:pimeloyl-ACP methyl ester carboxylesterase